MQKDCLRSIIFACKVLDTNNLHFQAGTSSKPTRMLTYALRSSTTYLAFLCGFFLSATGEDGWKGSSSNMYIEPSNSRHQKFSFMPGYFATKTTWS